MMTSLDELLKRPVAYHPVLAKATGSVNAALMLSQAIYWQKRVTQPRPQGAPGPDWWYHTIKEWQKETGLSRDEQSRARKRLVELGLLREKRAGVPARMWFTVAETKIAGLLVGGQYASFPKSGQRQSRCSNGRFSASKRDVNPQSLQAEITAEITPLLECVGTVSGSFHDNKTEDLEVVIIDYLRLLRDHCEKDDVEGYVSAAEHRIRVDQGGELTQRDKGQLHRWREAEVKVNKQIHNERLRQDRLKQEALDAELSAKAWDHYQFLLPGEQEIVREEAVGLFPSREYLPPWPPSCDLHVTIWRSIIVPVIKDHLGDNLACSAKSDVDGG